MTPFETIINDYVQKIKGVTRVFFERLNIFHKFLLIARFNAGEIPNLSHNPFTPPAWERDVPSNPRPVPRWAIRACNVCEKGKNYSPRYNAGYSGCRFYQLFTRGQIVGSADRGL